MLASHIAHMRSKISCFVASKRTIFTGEQLALTWLQQRLLWDDLNQNLDLERHRGGGIIHADMSQTD